MRDSFIFYSSFYEAIQALNETDRLACYDNITRYAMTGEEPADKTGVGYAIFLMARPQIDANNTRYENGKKGGEYGKLGGRPKKDNPTETPKKPLDNPTETPNINVNVNDNEEKNNLTVIPKEKTQKRFSKPSVEDIQAYCCDRNNGIDAEAFFSHYEAKGWLIGKTPMKDWKAAVRTWERNNKPHGSPGGAAYSTQPPFETAEERRIRQGVEAFHRMLEAKGEVYEIDPQIEALRLAGLRNRDESKV